MGYEFHGKLTLNKPLDKVTFDFLKKLNETRFGIEGEFYVKRDLNIICGNEPPRTQPGLWNQWIPTEDRMHIEWNGGVKFYNDIEWIEYIISKVLAPRGYVLNGTVHYQDRESSDYGNIVIFDNIVNGKRLIVDYSINKLLGEVKKEKNPPEFISMPVVKKIKGLTVNGEKTKHQKAKEKHLAEKKALEEKIALLEEQLRNKKAEVSKVKKLTPKEVIILKLKDGAKMGGSLEDFKILLKNLIEE